MIALVVQPFVCPQAWRPHGCMMAGMASWMEWGGLIDQAPQASALPFNSWDIGTFWGSALHWFTLLCFP